jgi:hypothetical protein
MSELRFERCALLGRKGLSLARVIPIQIDDATLLRVVHRRGVCRRRTFLLCPRVQHRLLGRLTDTTVDLQRGGDAHRTALDE